MKEGPSDHFEHIKKEDYRGGLTEEDRQALEVGEPMERIRDKNESVLELRKAMREALDAQNDFEPRWWDTEAALKSKYPHGVTERQELMFHKYLDRSILTDDAASHMTSQERKDVQRNVLDLGSQDGMDTS